MSISNIININIYFHIISCLRIKPILFKLLFLMTDVYKNKIAKFLKFVSMPIYNHNIFDGGDNHDGPRNPYLQTFPTVLFCNSFLPAAHCPVFYHSYLFFHHTFFHCIFFLHLVFSVHQIGDQNSYVLLLAAQADCPCIFLEVEVCSMLLLVD